MLFGKHINKYYAKYWLYFLIGIVFLIVVDYLQLYIPEFLGQIIDFFNGGSVSDHEDEISKIILYVILVAFGMFIGRVIWRFSIFHAALGITADLREEMFLKSERLSSRYYHENKVGNIISWFTTDLEQIEELFGWGTIMLVDALFLTVFVLIKMFVLDWLLTLITLFPILLIVIWGFLVEKFMEKKWDYRQKAMDKLYDFSQENFTGLRVIKAFVKENQQLHAFAKICKENKDVNINFVKVSVIFDALIQVICSLIVVFILGFGSWLVYSTVKQEPINIFGKDILFSAGNLVTFIGYFEILVWPMIALGQIFTTRSRAKASLKRISEFLDEEEEIKNCENPIVLDDVKGNIKFQNFSFLYPNSKVFALKDIDFEIKEGENIGVVGKIGSGKTTLVNSLLRLYNLDENSILIDGNDLMKCDIESLRNNIAYVPQDNFLFSETISSNISFADENLSEEEILEAAKFADVDDNIQSFKDKYQTVSGERGVTLSGGQKQRVSIARAYVKNAPIMILDDSVSAVDVKTEETILKNIKEKRAGKTTIVVASRISTVANLDKILVLNDGKIEGFDTHANLMKTCKTYQKMVYLQGLEKEINGGAENV